MAQANTGSGGVQSSESDPAELLAFVLPLVQHWKLLAVGPLIVGVLALGATFLIPPTFTSRTTFMPPQQQQSAGVAALAQLGALSGLAGAVSGIKSPADQFVSLLQSVNVADRLIDEFKLMEVYDAEYRFEARKSLAENSRIALGKKDGLITIEVDDHNAQRAADLANRYVAELVRLTTTLAISEAQQRRSFFQIQLEQTRDRLAKAQAALQASGLGQGTLKADARVAAEGYARLRAEVTAAEVRLQTLRRNLADGSTEVQQALATLGAQRSQLRQLEESVAIGGGPDYIGKFREFKYQETLFELFARQFELARLDESREGALIQVVDVAKPAEWKSKPKRAMIGAGAAVAALIVLLGTVLVRDAWRRSLAVHRKALPEVGTIG